MSNEAEFERKLDEDLVDLDRQNRAVRRRNLLLVLVAVLAVIFGVVAFLLAQDNRRLADANAQYGQEQAQEKKTIAKEAQKALCGTKDREIYDQTLCEKWAEVSKEPVPSAPVAADGPSQEDLVKAFREYCAEGNCKGRDGAAPTADDIAAAFVKFCSDGRCTGPAGKDAAPAKDGADGTNGMNGANGKDGQSLPPSGEMVLAAVTTYCSTTGACVGAAGKDGPPPSAEVVLAAVQEVCANDACRGPMGPAGADSTVPGPEGPQGPEGPAGRGLQSQFCGDDRRWLITYTDGTTADGGVCRESPIPPGIGVTP